MSIELSCFCCRETGSEVQATNRDLPDSTPKLIFSQLHPEGLESSASVSRSWEPLADDMLVNSVCRGAEKWSEHFGVVGEVPPLPKDIANTLRSPCPFWLEKKIWETHWLMLIPDTVNGEPLTLNNLEKLAKPGSANRLRYHYSDHARIEHGDVPVKAHWVLMTRDIIPGGRGHPSDTHKHFYQVQNRLVERAGYEVPGLLEAASCIFMEHAISGAYPFNRDPYTYTYCKEKDNHSGSELALGAFAPGGLWVGCLWDYGMYGVAALRNLNPEL